MTRDSQHVLVSTVVVRVDDESLSAIFEVPGSNPRGLVVLGHGLSASRESSYLRSIAAQLHARELATVSMDAPLHGTRRSGPPPASFAGWIQEWQEFWSHGGYMRMTAEFSAMLDSCPEAVAECPVGYWGISLATQTGIPWLASDSRPRAAVLGQFRGDGLLMQRFAPRVTIPVFFVQQQADELHPVEVSQRLFELLGSKRKTLRSRPGGHTEVPSDVLRESVKWLAAELDEPGNIL